MKRLSDEMTDTILTTAGMTTESLQMCHRTANRISDPQEALELVHRLGNRYEGNRKQISKHLNCWCAVNDVLEDIRGGNERGDH